jgi:pimeloyl-ACP methyl ester carboxylesterase
VIARDYLDCGPRRLLGTLAHAFADRIERKLPRVTVPTLVARGERDR